jgi:ABC-type multidrug transport system fused ATPase/permease subunit
MEREMEENDLKKIIKEMEEKKEEDLKRKFELLNKFFLLSSSLALIFGGLWFLLYSLFLVKDFPRSIDISLFYYIVAALFFLIIFSIYPLVSYLYVEYVNDLYIKTIEEKSNLERIFKSFQDNIVILEKDISEKSEKIKELEKIKDKAEKIKDVVQKIREIKEKDKWHSLQTLRIIQKIIKFIQKIMANLSLLSYIVSNLALFTIILKQDKFFIFFGYEIPTFPAVLLFIVIQASLFFILESPLKLAVIHKDKDALIFSLVFVPPIVILTYVFFFLTAPFYILKIGYFEANLTLEKEFVEKTQFYETYLEKCQIKDPQDNNYYKLFKFFIFLRTSSEYIVGCSKDSNVRIHIPSDKVIAIEYIEEDSKKEENKNTPAPQPTTN